MLRLKKGEWVRNDFRELKIMTACKQYILDTIMLVNNYINSYESEVSLHSYNTRNRTKTIKNQHSLKIVWKALLMRN